MQSESSSGPAIQPKLGDARGGPEALTDNLGSATNIALPILLNVLFAVRANADCNRFTLPGRLP
jgi:hypothetical protein